MLEGKWIWERIGLGDSGGVINKKRENERVGIDRPTTWHPTGAPPKSLTRTLGSVATLHRLGVFVWKSRVIGHVI